MISRCTTNLHYDLQHQCTINSLAERGGRWVGPHTLELSASSQRAQRQPTLWRCQWLAGCSKMLTHGSSAMGWVHCSGEVTPFSHGVHHPHMVRQTFLVDNVLRCIIHCLEFRMHVGQCGWSQQHNLVLESRVSFQDPIWDYFTKHLISNVVIHDCTCQQQCSG